MRCPTCQREMIALFTSYACDYCDGVAEVNWHCGYVIFRGDEDFWRPIYVFPSQMDAALYRSHNGWQQFPIREVHFEIPVRWRPASSHLTGVTIADKPFELHRDHRFAPQPYHCYLVPLRNHLAA